MFKVQSPKFKVQSFIVLFVYLFLTGANLYFGELNQDEGWYLYAAQRVHDGFFPYRDFAYTQAPVMPFVYSIIAPLVEKWGLMAGRIFTALLGLAAAVCAALLAGRLVAKENRQTAILAALTLISINVYHNYFTTVVKTYSLCAFFLSAGFLSLSFLPEDRSRDKDVPPTNRVGGASRPRVVAILSAILFSCAAGTRISVAVVLSVAFFYLVWMRKNWFAFGVGAGLASIAIFLPWLFVARESFLFGLLEYHSSRSAGSFLSMLVYKAGFISRVVQAYYLPLALWLIALVAIWLKLLPSRREKGPCLNCVVWWAVLAVTLVHLSAPFPYDDYQVVIYPLFVAALVGMLSRWLNEVAFEKRAVVSQLIVVCVFLASVASAISSPINQNWMIRGRDRIWWRLKEASALKQLQEAGRWIREHSQPGDTLLTQDLYLAVEAGRKVPEGLEMGPFSYFPDISNERADALHVMNRERMEHLLRTTDANVAAFSGYALAIRSPDVEEISAEESEILSKIISERYGLAHEIPYFGQGATSLKVWVRK